MYKACLCGKPLHLLARTQEVLPDAKLDIKHDPDILIWACPPDGCGRILLESNDASSTWYLPEQNDKKDEFG
jgi:hypothetical protein